MVADPSSRTPVVARGRRAVVLVGGPAAPYSRALRIARALAAEAYAVEIAAIAAPGLPAREDVPVRAAGTITHPAEHAETSASAAATVPAGAEPRIELRRYRPRGWQAFLGASDFASGTERAGPPMARAWPARFRRVLGVAAAPLLDLRRWILWPHAVRGWWVTLRDDLRPADLYHACGALTVAAALDARRRHPVGPGGGRASVIYDVIDFAPESNTVTAMPDAIRRRVARIDAGWAQRADAVVTINAEIAELLRARSADPMFRVAVVPNLPEPAGDRNGRLPAPIREAAALPGKTRIVLVHGRLGPDLGLDQAAEAILAVPDAALVLVGFGRGFAASRARDRDPRFVGRHVTLDAVHPDDVVRWTAAADVCLIPLPPISANQRLSTPNKFWEAIAGGSPVVVVRGMTAMERLVDAHDLGAIASSPAAADLATAIREVLDRLDADGRAWRTRIAAFADRDGGWPAAAATYRGLIRDLSARP